MIWGPDNEAKVPARKSVSYQLAGFSCLQSPQHQGRMDLEEGLHLQGSFKRTADTRRRLVHTYVHHVCLLDPSGLGLPMVVSHYVGART